MAPAAPPHTVVAGTGNPWRRDDGAGREVVRRLRSHALPGVRLMELDGQADELIEAWQGADLALVVDAVSSGAAPGTIHRLDGAEPLPTALFTRSTHGFGVAQAVELARNLGRLPRRLIIYGIEGGDFAAGEGLSPEVAAAVAEVVERIVKDLRRLSATHATERAGNLSRDILRALTQTTQRSS